MKARSYLLLSVVAITTAAAAQTTCPLTVTEISKGGNIFRFVYKNASDKMITGVEFRSVYVDPVGNKIPGEKMVSGDKVKPGKKGYARYEEYLHQDEQLKPVLFLITVVFADGSRWEHDANTPTQCSWENKAR